MLRCWQGDDEQRIKNGSGQGRDLTTSSEPLILIRPFTPIFYLVELATYCLAWQRSLASAMIGSLFKCFDSWTYRGFS